MTFVPPLRTPWLWENDPNQVSPLSAAYLTQFDQDIAGYVQRCLSQYDTYNVTANLGGASGGVGLRRTPVSADYTMSASDGIVAVIDTSVARYVTLPDPTTCVQGQQFVIKDESGNASVNAIYVNGDIDGIQQTPISLNYGLAWVYCNGGGFSALSYTPIPTPTGPPVVTDP